MQAVRCSTRGEMQQRRRRGTSAAATGAAHQRQLLHLKGRSEGAFGGGASATCPEGPWPCPPALVHGSIRPYTAARRTATISTSQRQSRLG